MADDRWASTDDHAAAAQTPQPQASGWASTDDHAATAGPVVRPGASDDEIIRSFGFNPDVIKQSSRYQAALKEHGSGVSFILTDPSQHPSLQAWRNAPVVAQLGDTGLGAADLVMGMGQLVRHGLNKLGGMSGADVQYGDLLDRVATRDYQTNVRQGNSSKALEFLGNVLFPVPGSNLIKGESLAANVVRGIVTGGTAAAMQPVDTGGGQGYWGNKGIQAGTGAGLGAGVGAFATGISRLTGKAVNAPSVKLPEELAADAERETQAAQAAADRGVTAAQTQADAAELMARNRSASQIRSAEQRAAQTQANATGAAKNLAGRLEAGMNETPWGSLQDVQAAAESGDRHAREVLQQVNRAETPGRIQEASINLQNWRTGQQANELYGKVGDLVDAYQMGPAPLQRTSLALSAADAEAGTGLRDRALTGTLQDARRALTPEGPATPAALDDIARAQAGKGFEQLAPEQQQQVRTLAQTLGLSVPPQPAQAPMQANYVTARKVISQLDEMIRSGRTGDNALISDRGTAQLQRIKNALEDDVQDYVARSGHPDLLQAQQSADQFYRDVRVPFRNAQVAKAGSTDEADTIFNSFIQAGRGDKAQKFYEALDPKGQSAVQYNMVASAINGATDPVTGAFDHAKFVKGVEGLKDSYGVFFQGHDKWAIDGLKNLMRQAALSDEGPAALRALSEQSVKEAQTVGKANVKAAQESGKAAVDAVKEAGQARVDAAQAQLDRWNRYPLGTVAAAGLAGAEASRLAGLPGVSIATGSVGAVAGMTKALLMTPGGRRFLLAASSLQPNSPVLGNLLDKAIREVPGMAARGATFQGQ